MTQKTEKIKIKYYAIRVGRQTGIFTSWNECFEYTNRYPNAEFKKFKELSQAEEYLVTDTSLDKGEGIGNSGLHAYISGSFDRVKDKAFYGSVILQDGDLIHKIFGATNKYTNVSNVTGKLAAFVYTLTWAINQGYKEIIIHYDYVGIFRWANGQWKANKEYAKRYIEFMELIKDRIDIKFVYFEDYRDNEYSRMAYKLSKSIKNKEK